MDRLDYTTVKKKKKKKKSQQFSTTKVYFVYTLCKQEAPPIFVAWGCRQTLSPSHAVTISTEEEVTHSPTGNTVPGLAVRHGRGFQHEPTGLTTTTLFKASVYALSRSVTSDSLQPHERQPIRLLYPWDFPDKHNAVGCHFLLQGIFLTQRSDPCHQTPALAVRFFTTSTTWKAPK